MPKGQQFWKSRKTPRNSTKNDPFWAKSCSLCPAKPLYMRRKHTFCRDHKPILLKLLAKDIDRFDSKFDDIVRRTARFGENLYRIGADR